MTSATSKPPALHIDTLVVKADRIVCELALNPKLSLFTTPQFAKIFVSRFPNLVNHTCKNPHGTTFGAAINSTALPHLFEHLVIDLQAKASTSPDETFVGTSTWTEKALGRARVEVSFTDDLSALRAFRDAARILNDALLEYGDLLAANDRV
ncbi:MAG: hypothetical protein FWG24_03060 [Eggerthellaceae bacterium]|jgi:hypothetical protein|nr:hypothetical protein [Eggerthellaceae bacterium]MDR2721827.1 hypothetical protein [Coriobacteriaceae bacterium]